MSVSEVTENEKVKEEKPQKLWQDMTDRERYDLTIGTINHMMAQWFEMIQFTCAVVDKLSSASLKQVIKHAMMYPLNPDDMIKREGHELKFFETLTKQQKGLYDLLVRNKDLYIDLHNLNEQAEFFRQKLGLPESSSEDQEIEGELK